jgi:hypothetical protein
VTNIALYNIVDHKVEFCESYDETRTKRNQYGETGAEELARNIFRLGAECECRNPQMVDADGRAYDRGPWFVYSGAAAFDWDLVDHQPTEAELAAAATAKRKAEILANLSALDAKSLRPLRAVAAGTGTDEDKAMLTTLEEEAAAYRVELATLATSEAANA